ncbi:hypothetical protein [Microlunatus antarcticus]|uniref:Uncharacterized protein n=1 Tax=Microlunatus antarcticus TaxID=53388 RepID=A0A7W5P8Q5_9ACTN|nr:hypothetical protein [Microlunatus antarcticus]MBB3328823.1 hypothetical protein [Microlunatus antarcticus]
MWQSDRVQPWVIVMIAVVVVAAALTVYGALSDRAKNRRRAAEMLGPPKRDIPNLPTEARSPAYVTEAQARRRPEGAPFDKLRERGRDEPVGTHDERRLDVGYASAAFVITPGARDVVLDDALVLVCADGVETIRELLPALEQAIRSSRPLVVVAPTIAPDVLGTLEVNAIQGKVPGVAVLADDAVRTQVAEATGAVPVDATDRRSGWLDPQSLGHAARWTSTRTTSRIAPSVRTGAAG